MWELIKQNEFLFKLILGIFFLVVVVVLLILAHKYEQRQKHQSSPIKKMTAISVFAALSVVLYYFPKINVSFFIPFMPSFLEIHFSNVPIYITGFLFGPLSGTVVVFIRMLVKLPASSTLGVGELADLLIGVSTVLVAAFMYHKNKTKKGSIAALGGSVLVWTLVATVSNWVIILPFYIYLYDFNVVYAMISMIPGITEANYMFYYLVIAIVPFNLILSSLVAGITFLIYKRISVLYDSVGKEK